MMKTMCNCEIVRFISSSSLVLYITVYVRLLRLINAPARRSFGYINGYIHLAASIENLLIILCFLIICLTEESLSECAVPTLPLDVCLGITVV